MVNRGLLMIEECHITQITIGHSLTVALIIQQTSRRDCLATIVNAILTGVIGRDGVGGGETRGGIDNV